MIKGIKDSWKEYMEKLMNEENEWDHKLSAEVKEGPADCIRMDEVRAALKEMKRHKAPGLSGLSHLPTPSVFFSFAEEITLFAFCLLYLYSILTSSVFSFFHFPYFIFLLSLTA